MCNWLAKHSWSIVTFVIVITITIGMYNASEKRSKQAVHVKIGEKK